MNDTHIITRIEGENKNVVLRTFPPSAYCKVCGTECPPCPARFDGEPTFVGYYSCPKHPDAMITLERPDV